MRTRTVRLTGAAAVVAIAVYALLLAWSVYASACMLNHAGVWPFSYLGQG